MKYHILMTALIAGSMVLAGCKGTGAADDTIDTAAYLCSGGCSYVCNV